MSSIQLSGFQVSLLEHHLENRRRRLKLELKLPVAEYEKENSRLDGEMAAKSVEMDTTLNFIELGLKSIADRADRGELTVQQCRDIFQEVNDYFKNALGDLMNAAYALADTPTNIHYGSTESVT